MQPPPPPANDLYCTPGASEPCFDRAQSKIGVGTCKAGVKTCNLQGTAFSACIGQVLPTAEICGDGLDNDCDGIVDCPVLRALTVRVTGVGNVTSSPAGINCGGSSATACSADFADGTVVSLIDHATPPNTGVTVTGDCSTNGCNITMTAPHAVNIAFFPPISGH